MKAGPEDRLNTDVRRKGFTARHVVLIVVVIAVGLLLWTSRVEHPAPQPIAEPEVVEELVVEPEPLPPAPDIPPPPVVELAPEVEEPPAPVLPALEDSDQLMREQLAAAGAGPELDKLQQSENLVQTGAALVDGFSRGLVLYKLLPVDPPAEAFAVEQQGESTYMNPAGYQRYDGYAEAIAAMDTSALVDNFHLMRPLYEQAYAQLGLPADDFDNALIRLLDRVIATPEIEQPIELTRKSVMYLYADPDLEKLSAVQKQLLRMGPDNIRRIKAQARALRAGLLSQP